MPASVRDVAARAGVSVGTVSNVLNRPERVSPATIERVQAAIAELGFVRNDAARMLRAGDSHTIGLIVLDLRNPFFTEVARGAEERAAELGFSVFVANSDKQAYRELAHLAQFERQRVFGVLVTPLAENMGALCALHARGTPVVLVDRESADTRFPSVSVDDLKGGRIAAQHLLDQGYRRIAFLGGPTSVQQVADRLEGAGSAVGDVAGAELEHLATTAMSMVEGRRAGYELAAHVREGKPLPDAVFAGNDLLALGFMQSMSDSDDGLSLPKIPLIGYDDIDYAAFSSTALSSIRQPAQLIGSTAVDLLVQSAGTPDGVLDHIRFDPELVVRASSVSDGRSRPQGAASVSDDPAAPPG